MGFWLIVIALILLFLGISGHGKDVWEVIKTL